MKLIIGVDEAGRGPLAGPVTVGIFVAEQKIQSWLLKNIFPRRRRVGAPTKTSGKNFIRDSKKLSTKKREEIYQKFLELKKDPTSLKFRGASKIDFSVSHISNKIIDKVGISKAVQIGIIECLKNLTPFTSCSPSPINRRGGKPEISVRLDGLLKAPEEFKNQKTIIKGDEKDVFIACASIVAKVSRDRLMCRLAKKYPKYGFEIHKGYGTLAHRHLIQKHGLSSIHRHSFCKNLTLTSK